MPAGIRKEPGEMPDEVTEAETAEPTNEDTSTTEDDGKLSPPPELQAVIDKERQTAREAEKARKALERELADLRKQTMTDTEKAIDDARTEARQQALAEVGSRVAAAELRAAATGRLDADQIDTLLDSLNLARFMGEDGEVDVEGVRKFVDGIAPRHQPARGAIDQGARSGSTSTPADQFAAVFGG